MALWLCAAAAAGLAVLCALPLNVQVLPNDAAFVYEGRWLKSESEALADWPCTGLRFQVQASAPGEFSVQWHSRLSRVKLTVDGEAREFGSWLFAQHSTEVKLPKAGNFTVTLRKLSGSHPLGTGLGRWLPSRLAFRGLGPLPPQLQLRRPPKRRRRMEVLGTGDALGFCVAGSSSLGFWSAWLRAWQLQSCEAGWPSLVAEELEADLSLQALPGVGVVQNAYHHGAHHLHGAEPMLSYWPRVLAGFGAAAGAPRRAPEVVVVNLGEEDFKQPGRGGPTNVTFRTMYNKLLHSVINAYGGFRGRLAVLALGGCGAAALVEEAVGYFNDKIDLHADNATVRVKYFQLPCEKLDEGCLGFPGPARQASLAQGLAPELRFFMGW